MHFLFLILTLIQLSCFASDKNPVAIDLVCENSTVKPGESFWMLVHFKIDPDWHIYWVNPGDAGAPPHIEWNLPQGICAQDPLFPAPKRFTVGNSVGFGYENEVSLLVPMLAAKDLALDSTLNLQAVISYVACRAECIPGNWSGNIALQVKEKSEINPKALSIFQTARNLLPTDFAFATATREDGTLQLIIPFSQDMGTVHNVEFFPRSSGIVDIHQTPVWDIEADGKTLVILLPLQESHLQKTSLNGVLRITYDGDKTLSINIGSKIQKPQDDIATSSPYEKYEYGPPQSSQNMSIEEVKEFVEQEIEDVKELMNKNFFIILGFAFVGGMILNLMPCVLPVISIKLVHYIKMRGTGFTTQIKHGLAFAFGILISFWVLAATLVGLQTAGKTVGWGFQLQEPLFVAALIIVIFILSVSLFGVFEFGLKIAQMAQQAEEHGKTAPSSSQERMPSLGSTFFSGVLATFVATPCTGPLLGSTLGLTATLNPAFSFMIFTALGLGMAFPYLFLSLFPGLAYLIPRPGRWMVTFKQLMGFFMMATVVWLVWVLSSEVPTLGTASVFASLFVIGFGLWIYGTWGGIDRKRWVRAFGRILALLFVLYGSFFLMNQVFMQSMHKSVSKATDWETFSPERLNELKQNNIVFVNFTAKWCLTCQANKIILESPEVRKAFEKYSVIKLVADWTDGDPEITRFIQSIGRNGVPVYALYKKGSEKPVILPELLTQEIVVQALKDAQTQ